MSRKLHHHVIATALLGFMLTTGGAMAQTPVPSTLWVAKNGAAVVDLATEAGAVTVANPDIADVTPMGGKRLIIMGRTVGQTDLLVYDQAGNRLLSTRLAVTPQLNGSVVVNRGVEEDVMICAPICASINPRQNAPPPGGDGGAAAIKNLLGGGKPAE
jgi:hypothetical protein